MDSGLDFFENFFAKNFQGKKQYRTIRPRNCFARFFKSASEKTQFVETKKATSTPIGQCRCQNHDQAEAPWTCGTGKSRS